MRSASAFGRYGLSWPARRVPAGPPAHRARQTALACVEFPPLVLRCSSGLYIIVQQRADTTRLHKSRLMLACGAPRPELDGHNTVITVGGAIRISDVTSSGRVRSNEVTGHTLSDPVPQFEELPGSPLRFATLAQRRDSLWAMFLSIERRVANEETISDCGWPCCATSAAVG